MMKNILVSIDFDNNEDLLVTKALEFGKAFDAKIWFVHIAAPDPDFVGYDVGPQYIRDARADELKDEHINLQEYSKMLNENGIESEALLIQGSTIEMINKEANKLKADLIIMGQNKKGFFYKTFFGSVSENVMRNSQIPVLVIPFD